MSEFRTFAWLALFVCCGPVIEALPPDSSPLEITATAVHGTVRLRFPTRSDLALEQAAVIPGGPWTRVPFVATAGATVQEVELPASDVARFFRLRQGTFTTVTETSPMNGESGVAVTRESIVWFSAPLAADTTLDSRNFFATFGGRRILARPELSSDHRKASLFYLEPLPASARILVVLDATGLRDEHGKPLDLEGTGVPGGLLEFPFETLSLTTLPNTAVIGTVYAAEPRTDAGGARHDVPLEGVTLTVDGAEETLRARTDAEGHFRLEPVPPGRFFVHIDGRTATGSSYPAGPYYPAVGKAWEAVAGNTTNLAGGTGTIYLPRIGPETLQPVSPTVATTIGFPIAVVTEQPALADVRLTVPANSLFADNGTRGGKVGIAPVPPDRLPGPLPDGLQMPLVITVQTDGALNFDQPASICFPNLPDPVLGTPLPAGSAQALVSFDHKKGVWVVSGPMTVSADGRTICTDPGSGIRQPGWHGVAPPPFRSPPPPKPERCEEEDAGADLAGPAVLQDATPRKRKNCACKPDPKWLDQLNDNCTKLLEACVAKATAKAMRGMKICTDCDPFEFPSPCTTDAGKAFQQRCFKKSHLTAISERAACYVDNKDCVERAYACAGPKESLASTLGLQGQTATVEEQIVALISAAQELIRPFAEQDADLPENVLASVAQLITQADTLGGGDAAAYLDTQYADIAAEFGESAATFEPGNAPEYPVDYAATINRGGTRVTLRGETEAYGQYAVFVPRDGTLVDVSFFDAQARLFGSVSPVIISNRAAGILISNRVYQLPRLKLEPIVPKDPDTDADGLSDAVEAVLGTDPTKADSDGDGIPDGAEVQQGTQPLDGRVVKTGVIATARTPGPAVDLWTGNELVVTAEGTFGISVFRPYNGSNPTIAAHVPTPGNAFRVTGSRGWIVAAQGNAGVSLLRATNAATVAFHRQVNLAGAQAVAADPRTAYVGLASGQIAAVDLESGEIRARANLVGAVQDLELEGDVLYALTGDRIAAFRLTDDGLDPLGSAASPFVSGANHRLFVGNGLAYTVHRKGFNTFDVSDPAIPVLRSRGETTLFGWFGLVSNGSGTGVAAVGPNSTDDGPHDVSLYDLRDSTSANLAITTFPTPGIARAVSILNGLAYAADDRAGLQVINYLPYDAQGVPPSVRFPTGFGAAGLEESKLASVTALATDDVQVRHVEFYVDGVLVETDGGFPFEFRFPVPKRSETKTNFRLRARAVDTGGNATWSEELTLAVLPDRSAPRVQGFSPLAGARSVTSVVAFFTEALDPRTLSANALRLTSAGPDARFGTADDAPMAGTSAQLDAAARSLTVTLSTALPTGLYRATVAPSLADLAGNPLAEAFSWEFRVADAVFWSRPTDGAWEDPLNWSGAAVPGAADAVVIDVPGLDLSVTRANGAIVARSLFTTETLAIQGGSLEVTEGIDLQGTLSLTGTILRNSAVTVSGSGRLAIRAGTASTFDNVTVNGDLDLSQGDSRLRVRNSLRVSGQVLIGGLSVMGFAGNQTFDHGTVVFTGEGGHLSVDGNSTLTLGPNMVVRGKSGTLGQPVFAGGSSTLINQGLISADVAGGTLALRSTRFENASTGRLETHNGGSVLIASGSWANAGVITASGGALTLDGAFENTGSLVANAATVNLDGDFTLAKLGAFQRTGAEVHLRSVLDLRGGALNLDAATGSWTLDGGRILGGTINQSETGRLILSSSPANTLDAVTVNGDLDLTGAGAPRLHIRNGLTLSGRVLLAASGVIGFAGVQTFDTGSVVFIGDGGNLSVDGNSTLALGPNMVVRGKSGTLGQPVFAGGSSTLINQGLISADVAGGILAIRATRFENASNGRLETHNGGSVLIASGSWANAGVITASGGALTLDGAFENTGSLVANAATVNLDGDFTLAKLGAFQRTGGEVHLRSVLDLRGTSLDLDATTGSWILDGGRILGGTVNQSNGGRVILSSSPGNTFDAVKVNGDLDLTAAGAPRLHVRNGLTLSGRVLIGGFGVIGFAGVQTFNTGSVVFTGDGGHLSVDGNSTLTLGPEMVVRGKTGTLGQPVFAGGSSTLINQGLISADVAGGILAIRATRFEDASNGRLETHNGGSVLIASGSWANAGVITASGGALTLDGAFENTGSLVANAATVNLDGDFTLAKLGAFQRTGGEVHLRSVLDLRGTSLDLDATTGSWILDGGRILGGTVNQSTAGRLILNSSPGNTLDAVTVNGDLDLTGAGAPRLHVRNGLTLSGSVLIGGFGVIGFAGVQTFDTGSVVFTGDGGHLSVDGNSTLTLGPNMVVRGKTGTLGQPVFAGGSSTLINQGLISADVAGGTLTIRATVFQNEGRLEEKNGGRIVRP